MTNIDPAIVEAAREWVDYLLTRLGHDPASRYLPGVRVVDSLTDEVLSRPWFAAAVDAARAEGYEKGHSDGFSEGYVAGQEAAHE